MKKELCIITCNSLAPEISHLIQSGDYPDVRLKSFPAICTGCMLNNKKVSEIVGDDIGKFSKILFIVSNCRAKEEKELLDTNIEFVRLEQCFEMLFNRQSIYHFIRQGNYLVSNGWLRNYERHVREWGFTKETAQRFFQESTKRIILLETGLPGDYMPNLTKLSDYMGLPYEVFPVGTSHLKSFLESQIFTWRNDEEKALLNQKISTITREVADYSLMFHELKKLIDHTDEEVIINEIAKLIDLLFIPEQIAYHHFSDNIKTGETFFKPPFTQPDYSEGDSFIIEIKHRNKLIGSYLITRVQFPKYLSEYKLLGDIINQFGGLAIENARKYSELEKAKKTIGISEQHFRIIFEQAPLGIALIDSITGEIKNLNSKFAEIAGRSKEELLNLDWMSITHPDDTGEDLSNMALLNAGKIKGFHIDKRFITPNGKIVWISMTIAPVEVADKAHPMHLSMVENITEQRRLEEEIRKNERLFKTLMLQSPSVIELYDLDGLQISVNKAYEELWGFPADHTVNKFNILKSEEVKRTGLIDYVRRAYYGESVQVPEYLFDSSGKTEGHGKGRSRWLSTRIYPLKDKNEKVTNIIITHEDVTLKKQAENVLSENVQKFKNLSLSGTEMLNLPSLEAIYNYLTETFHQQYPKAVILFSTVNEAENISTLKIITGINNNLIQRALKFTGFNFYNKDFTLLPFHKNVFKTGKFHHFEGGLASFSGDEFPNIAAKTIEKLLGIKQIYTIGINKEENLYAIFHFFNRDSSPITDDEYIESFVRQAGIVIERKILEGLLKESEGRYRFIAENMSDVIWSLSIQDLRFNYISPSVTHLTGFSVEEAMQHSVEDALEEKSAHYVLTELPKRMAEFYSGNRAQKVSRQELQQRCKDGSLIWVEFTTMFKIDGDGKITDIIGITRNINERKQAEIEIQQKNNELSLINAEKDRFFSIIAHDLRSPFASLVGLAEMMANETIPLSREEYLSFSRSLYKTASSTYNLLENLLEWSMLQRGATVFNPVAYNLKEFFNSCDEAIIELAHKKSVNLDIPDNIDFEIFVDINMLHTIMRNLVSNAIKFTPTGGSISITVEKLSNGDTLFRIKDSGIGMDQEIVNNLFKVDKNVSRQGTNGEPSTGLGLILCKEFLEKHGGKIWVESIVGKGSSFFFTIPQK
jgi:PAS domain S-box-containing protein